MPNTIYFIDSENVISPKSLDLSIPNREDYILFFFTENSGNISPKILIGMKANFVFKEVAVGDQQIDMHIATELGYQIALNKADTKYVIISNDGHYSKIVNMWKSKGYIVSQISTLISNNSLDISQFGTGNTAVAREPEEYVAKSNSKKATACCDNVSKLLKTKPNLSTHDDRKKIRKIVNKRYGTNTFQKDVRSALINLFGKQRGEELYKLIKDAL